MAAKDFTYEITEEIGVISTSGAWALELNKVSWNKKAPTFDLRKWTDDHEKMGKGVTMSETELRALRDLIDEYLSEGDEEDA